MDITVATTVYFLLEISRKQNLDQDKFNFMRWSYTCHLSHEFHFELPDQSTSNSRVLLYKQTAVPGSKKFLAFYRTRSLTTVFTRTKAHILATVSRIQ